MEQELKTKWINALRSGDYKQAKGQLKTDEGHCCLGVLACVAGLKISEKGVGILDREGQNAGWKPIHDIIGFVNAEILWQMNDGYPVDKTFSQIADYIEKNL